MSELLDMSGMEPIDKVPEAPVLSAGQMGLEEELKREDEEEKDKEEKEEKATTEAPKPEADPLPWGAPPDFDPASQEKLKEETEALAMERAELEETLKSARAEEEKLRAERLKQ